MKRNILTFLCGIGLVCSLWSCKSGDKEFPGYEGGSTVYFPYQYPVRTIVLGDDEYDVTQYDWNHKCQIKATFGGLPSGYGGSNGSVTVAVDESLCDNLYFEDGITPVKAMPSSYYHLSTTTMNFNGTMNGSIEVQLTEDFFDDLDAATETYVIPLVMTSQTGFGKILTGQLLEGFSGSRTDASVWDVKPMDYILYCVKFQNKFSGFWRTHGTTSTLDIEHAKEVEIETVSLNDCLYKVSFQKGEKIYTADLLLSFSGDNCTISSATEGVTATGSGSWGDNTEKKAWGNKDRDGMELKYTVNFGDKEFSTHEKLVWERSGVKTTEFAPVYAN